MPPVIVIGGYEAMMLGRALITGVMAGHAATNVMNSMHQNQSEPAQNPTGQTPADQSEAAQQGANNDLAKGQANKGCPGCEPDDKDPKKRWTKGKADSPEQNAEQHWNKHQGEFPEYANADDYVNGAHNFVDNPPDGTLTKPAPQGGTLMYDPESNTFASVD